MEDERLSKIKEEQQKALNESNTVYNGLLQDNQNLYNLQNENLDKYESTQNDILDKRLAYNESLINQQKDVARQNKETEERKALNDYTSYVNPYGYQNESLASNGLLNTGLSETTKLGAYNRYQNRVSTANKVMQDAFTQFDNDINQARLENDAQKAQNALNKLQMQLDFANNFYTNKSNITMNQLSNNQNLDNNYYNRYQTEYGNIQAEKERAEKIRQWEAQFAEDQRQYNESLAFQKAQAEQDQANWEKEYALAKQKNSGSKSSPNGTRNETLLPDSNAANGVSIVANPFTKDINVDAKYGVFDTGNGTGYQPDNINGQKLEYGGYILSDFVGKKGSTNSDGKNIDNQKVWKLGNKYYTWDGPANTYVDITNYKNYGKSSGGGGQGSFGYGGSMGFR